MAEKSNGEMYDEEELGNIACFLQVSGLSKGMKGGFFRKTDFGTSMNPTIRAGDTVLCAKVENMELKVGDIILFKSPIKDGNIAHRIVGIIESKKAKGKYFLFLTKGDNLPNQDQWAIPGETVLGVVVGVIYKTRWGLAKNEEAR